MMRKKRVLLLLMAGVACLIGVIIGAEYNSPLIYIPFKICIGEGGVLRRVGKVVMARCSIFGFHSDICQRQGWAGSTSRLARDFPEN